VNRRFVTYLLGWLLLLDCAFLCLPLLASLLFRESPEPWVAGCVSDRPTIGTSVRETGFWSSAEPGSRSRW